MEELEKALADAKAAGEALVAMTAGFVNATLRAITVAGRVLTDPPEPIVYQAPNVPAGLAEVTKGSTFYTASWSAATSNDAYPILGYQLEENSVPLTSQTSLTQTRNGRTPSTAYSLRVRSFTIGASSAWSSAVVITTDASGGVEPVLDTTAPTVPVITSLTENSSTSATVTWTASTDAGSGVSYYKVWINGTPLTATVTPIVTATWNALTAGLLYRFSISAVDNAGNESAKSTEVSITMSGAIVIPPAQRVIVGAITGGESVSEGAFIVQVPTPAARTLDGAAETGATTSSGTLVHQANVDDPPVWNTPSVATTYSYAEGDTVDLTLLATDPEGNAITYSFASGVLPANLSFNATTRKISGVIAAGTGGYPTALDYDSYYSASDVVAVTPISISTTSIPTGQVAVPYSTTFTAANGYGPPYFWVLTTTLTSPLNTEITLHPTTGVLSGTPSVQFSGPIVVTATDPQSNSVPKQFTLTIGAAATDDFATRATTAKTLFATNFRDVYLGSGVGAAVLTPSRQINTTATLLASPYGAGHDYSVAEGLYGQVRNGVLQGPFADGTPRCELDTTTFPGERALRLPGRANDGQQGGNWLLPLNGVNGTLYRRVYIQFRVRFDREAIATRWDPDDHKIFMLGSNQDGQFIIAAKQNNGTIRFYYDVSRGIGSVPGTLLAAPNPFGGTNYHSYNQIDAGDTTLNGSITTVAEKNKWLENYGPFQGAYFHTGYGYDAAFKYLEDRPTTMLPRGWPDSSAFKNCPSWMYDQWITIQLFCERIAGTDLCSFQYWHANDGQPFTCLFKSIGNIPISTGSGDTYFSEIQILEYASDRIRGTAFDRNTWYKELQVSLAPIPGPGGHMPPDNQG